MALMLAFSWGLNWPAIKIVLGEVPPFALRTMGLGTAAVLLLFFAAWQGRRLVPPPGSRLGIVAAGALTIVAFNFCTAFAQLNTSTSRAAVLTYTMPTMSALLAWALLGERPGRRGAVAVALGALGIALLAWPALSASQGSAGMAGTSLRGPLFALAAALAWALGTIVTKKVAPVPDRVVATAWQLALGGVCGAIASALAGETWPRELSRGVALALGYHIVVATAFAYVLWYRLLDSASATVSSLTALAVPVVGVAGAMALVGDRPSGVDWAGFALVLAAAALVLLRR
ncbi:MAG: EamA family transporter [Betaproteobacteria bacterium]|nr:EamA family transporter [Betaproteobacteria bacterium]